MSNATTFARLLAFVALVSLAPSLRADTPPNIRKEEWAMLPPYCNAVQIHAAGKEGVEMYKKLIARYGDGWSHMHHFCWALLDEQRLNRRYIVKNPQDANPARMITNIDYVLERTGADFAPRAEVLAKKAKVEMRYFGRDQAARTAELLISEFPQVADGYVILADILLRSGKSAEATEVLERGAREAADKTRFEQLKSLLTTR